jgi:hypothetical protein
MDMVRLRLASAGRWGVSGLTTLKEYYWTQTRQLPGFWWQMGTPASPYRNRELSVSGDKHLQGDKWKVDLSAACIVCGNPTSEPVITFERIARAPWPRVHALLLGIVFGSLAGFCAFKWLVPIGFIVALAWGYRRRQDAHVVLQIRLCPHHETDIRFPELLLTTAPTAADNRIARSAHSDADKRLATQALQLVLRAGHARFKHAYQGDVPEIEAKQQQAKRSGKEQLRQKRQSAKSGIDVPEPISMVDDAGSTPIVSGLESFRGRPIPEDPPVRPILKSTERAAPIARDRSKQHVPEEPVVPSSLSGSGAQTRESALRREILARIAGIIREHVRMFQPRLPWGGSISPDPEAMRTCVQILQRDPEVSNEVAHRLIPALCEVVAWGSPSSSPVHRQLAQRAFAVLCSVGPAAVSGLCLLLTHAPDCLLRRQVWIFLGNSPEQLSPAQLLGMLQAAIDESEIGHLVQTLIEHGQANVLLKLLEQATPPALQQWRTLRTVLHDTEWETRLFEIWLGWLSSQPGPPELRGDVVTVLVDIAADCCTVAIEPILTLYAIAAQMKLPARNALWPTVVARATPEDADRILKILERASDHETMQRVVDLVWSFDTPGMRQRLLTIARNDRGEFTKCVLAKVAPTPFAGEFIDLLREGILLVADEDMAGICGAIVQQGDEEGVAIMVEALTDASPERSEAIWHALNQSCPFPMVEQLCAMLHERPEWQVHVLELLGRHGSQESPAVLARYLERWRPLSVRRAAAAALELFTRDCVPAYISGRSMAIDSDSNEPHPLCLDEIMRDERSLRGRHDRLSRDVWIGEQGVVASLVWALDDDDLVVRRRVARTLSHLGQITERLRYELLELRIPRVQEVLGP